MSPHHIPSASPRELFASFWRNRHLILQMTKREVVGRYRGSAMGLAWSFFNPILILTVYTFVFSVVFKARWSATGEENKIDFAILLFVGIIVFGVFAECANRAPGLILANVNFVKKVVFPLEILPWVTMGSALFHAGISLLVLLSAQLLFNHRMPFTAMFFPLIMLPLLFATIGAAWFLSAIGVYLRDVSQSIGVFTTVLMFVSPVVYPLSALPETYQTWIKLNPLTFILEEGRKSLIFGQLPDALGWGIHLLVSIMIAWMGFWWFQKSRKGFADVL
jgi:lipopolysaccharide transport system permease protein